MDTGSAHAFVRSGTSWSREAEVHGDPEYVGFGNAVSVWGDSAAVGAANSGGTGPGAALPWIYCTAKVNPLGCTLSIGFEGIPDAAATSGFTIYATSVRNKKAGLLLYSFQGEAAVPFQGGTLCIATPIERTPAQDSGGHMAQSHDCSGGWRIDMNAYASGQFGGDPDQLLSVPGTAVHCQWWGRDPDAFAGSALSNALEYHVLMQ
jgi:hypothetical protein